MSLILNANKWVNPVKRGLTFKQWCKQNFTPLYNKTKDEAMELAWNAAQESARQDQRAYEREVKYWGLDQK
jgi:hypothetical protein